MSNSVFICDENQAKSAIQQGAMIQDHGMIWAAERWAESSLTAENRCRLINDSIDSMPPEAKEWYQSNFGNGLRLVIETDMQGRPLGHIAPYVVPR